MSGIRLATVEHLPEVVGKVCGLCHGRVNEAPHCRQCNGHGVVFAYHPPTAKHTAEMRRRLAEESEKDNT